MPIPKWLAAPRLRAALPWFCGLLAAAIAAKNLVGGYGDLGIYLDAAREFRQGGIDLYRDRAGSGPWAYPPFVALPFAALQAALPDGPIRWLYCLLLGLGTALLLGDLARALRPFGGLRWWQWLAFGLLFQRCIAQNLTHGQLSLWVGTCVARGVVLLQRGSDRAAGVAFGLAAALKLTPLLFLLALPCMRRPRAALAMAMTVAVAWFVAPWPFCGAAEHLRHFGDFGRTVAGSLVARGGASIVEAYAGPSVAGTFDHLLQPRPIDARGNLVNVLDLGDGALLGVKLGWSLLLAALLGLWFWRARPAPDPQRLAQQCGAVALATAFFAPLVRVYHLAAVLVPFALFCRGPRGRADALWWAAALGVLFATTLRQRNLLGETLWRAFDAGWLLHLAMVGILGWLVREADPGRPTAPPP